MKISPFVLFLILLIVLVVSIIVGRKIGYEGFVSYQQSKTSTTSFVIPSYSQNTVYKLYDNLFLHYRAGGNWRGEGLELHKKLTEQLKEALI